MMLRLIVALASFVLAVWALPAEMPEPGQLALVFNEDDFEDYLDDWLAIEEAKWSNAAANATRATHTGGCTFAVNGDLSQPQPVFIRNGGYLEPSGNSGLIHLNTGETVQVACTGSGRTIQHPNRAASVASATATCVNDKLIYGAGWLNGPCEFSGLTCSSNSVHEPYTNGDRCYNDNLLIRIGFIVDGVFYPLYLSCFDQHRLEVLYVVYQQQPHNAVHQTGVNRPSFAASTFYPGVAVNTQYTQVTQKATIASYVGQELADKYVTSTQFLARGHLAAKTDFIYATGQRASFYFINAAPQWQPFNAGNWNWLEQNLRARIGVAGYDTVVYTGTYGVTQLRDQQNRLVDIYLYTDENNNQQIPVPLYYYKVVFDEKLKIGTAFVSINNPYYTEEEVRALTFCTDRCRNNAAFSWLNWQPDRIDLGYSFCCEIDDFRRTVPHLPPLTINGLLA